MLKILMIIAGVLSALGGVGVLPFIDPNLGLLIGGLCGALAGVILKVGDYLDNKVMDGSFKAEDASWIKNLFNIFKK